jgi:hypothetical protein
MRGERGSPGAPGLPGIKGDKGMSIQVINQDTFKKPDNN